jgi:hypothetical protein
MHEHNGDDRRELCKFLDRGRLLQVSPADVNMGVCFEATRKLGVRSGWPLSSRRPSPRASDAAREDGRQAKGMNCDCCKFNCNPEFVQSLFSLALSLDWTIISSRARLCIVGHDMSLLASWLVVPLLAPP